MAISPQRKAELDLIIQQQKSDISPERKAELDAIIAQYQGSQASSVSQRPNILQSIAKPFLKTATSGLNVLEGAAKLLGGDVKGANEAATRQRNFGILGSARPVGVNEQGQFGNTAQFAKDVFGTGLEIGAYAAPSAIGVGAKALSRGAGLANMTKNVARPTLASLGRAGALAGATGSTGAALQEDKNLGQVVGAGLTGGLAGGVLGTAVPGVGRAISSAVKGASKTISPTARVLTSQLSGLSPESISSIKAMPGQFGEEALKKEPIGMLEELGTKVKTALDDKISSLKETGTGYDAVRSYAKPLPIKRTVSGYPEFVAQTLKNKFGIGLRPDGTLILTDKSSSLVEGDVKAIERFMKQYGRSSSVTGDVFLNIRQGLDSMAKWDDVKRPKSADVAAALREEYDKVGKEFIPGLQKLDEKFSEEITDVNKLKQLVFDNNDELRANAYSTLSNLLKKSNIKNRKLLEELVPGISDEVSYLGVLEDIARSEGQKTGTYLRSALASTLGISGVVTANPAIIASALLYGVFGTPQNFIKAIRAFGYANEKFGKITSELAIKKIMGGKALSALEKRLINEVIKQVLVTPQRAAAIQLSN